MQVEEGLVWVYAAKGPGAAEDSKSGAQAAVPELYTPEYTSVTGWFQRDLPYGADVLLENVRLSVNPRNGGEGHCARIACRLGMLPMIVQASFEKWEVLVPKKPFHLEQIPA